MGRRQVIETVRGQRAIDGAGVHLVRVLGPNEVERFDPFLMLDAFDSQNPSDYIKGFPFHPHRGIETVTYLIKGKIEHQDSLGNKGVIHDGESQWMTAGSGIIHQEMPKPVDHMLGLQLWINLPKEEKMTEPKYFDITTNMVQTVEEPNTNVRIISGEYKEHSGPRGKHIDAFIFDIDVKPGEYFSMETDPDKNLFVYIIEGDGRFGDDHASLIPAKVAILFDKNDEFYVKAGENGIRFVLFEARPLKEPIAWGGPIVMNTRAELEQAFDELNEGTFLRTY